MNAMMVLTWETMRSSCGLYGSTIGLKESVICRVGEWVRSEDLIEVLEVSGAIC